MEVERKFLVKDESWKALSPLSYQRIKQFYIDEGKKYHTRVRILTFMDLGKKALLTIKESEPKMEREEYEMEIPLSYAQELESKAERIITKERIILRCDDLVTMSIDFFPDRSTIFEVEYTDKVDDIHSIELPSWVGKEITQESKYYSINN